MATLGVIHLVWVPLGLEILDRFLASYKCCPGGIDHDLIIVFNGFQSKQELDPFFARLSGINHQSLLIEPFQQDLASYYEAAQRCSYETLCFVNSYSNFQDAAWLAKLSTALALPETGVVGATGSWESWRPDEEDWAVIRTKTLPGRIAGTLRLTRDTARRAPFPNYHLRTNAFMMKRELVLRLSGMVTATKEAAWSFESGKNSMTRQILDWGLRPLVVGKDGCSYPKEEWHRSNTFRQGDQSNLLVSDNRTRHYEEADYNLRQMLWRYTWRGLALPPALPNQSYEDCLS